MQIIDDRSGAPRRCSTKLTAYDNGGFGIQLIEENTVTPYLTATIPLGRVRLPNHLVAVRALEECRGLPQVLIRGGVIEDKPFAHAATALGPIGLYRLTHKALAEYYDTAA